MIQKLRLNFHRGGYGASRLDLQIIEVIAQVSETVNACISVIESLEARIEKIEKAAE